MVPITWQSCPSLACWLAQDNFIGNTKAHTYILRGNSQAKAASHPLQGRLKKRPNPGRPLPKTTPAEAQSLRHSSNRPANSQPSNAAKDSVKPKRYLRGTAASLLLFTDFNAGSQASQATTETTFPTNPSSRLSG